MRNRGFGAALIGLAVAVPALATPVMTQSVTDQTSVLTGKTELVMPDITPHEAAAKVKDALSSWAIPVSINYRSLPSALPVVPGAPVGQEAVYGGVQAMVYHCDGAYAEIVKRPQGVGNAFFQAHEITQACVYPFQKGVKVYVIFTSVKKTESLTSGLFNGIATAIRGKDSDFIAGQMKDVTDAIRKNVPSLLVARIDIPEMEVQEPDHDAVVALIPEVPSVVPPSISPASIVPAPGQAAGTVPAAQDPKIEARKNLTGMGLSYFNQDQFVAAIQRKDDVAVKLFLDGDGINPTAADSHGRTPTDIANAAGAPNIAKLIQGYANGSAQRAAAPAVPGAPLVSTQLPVASSAQVTDLAALNLRLDAAEAQLSDANRQKLHQYLTVAEGRATPIQLALLRRQILSAMPESAPAVRDILVNPATLQQ